MGNKTISEFVDVNSVIRPTFTLDLDNSFGTGVTPGSGINMSDPYNPVLSPISPFKEDEPIEYVKKEIPKNHELISFDSFFESNFSEKRERKFLETHFKAKFGFSSAEAAYKAVNDSRKVGKAVYFRYSVGGWFKQLDNDHITWDDEKASIIKGDKQENEYYRLMKFIGKYGSHYILSVIYGYTFTIRVQINSKNETKQKSISAKINAAFSPLSSVKGSFRQEDVESLRKEDIEVQAVYTAGGIKDNTPFMITNIDQMLKFIEDFSKGSIVFLSGPIKINVNSYWPMLDESFSNISAILSPSYEHLNIDAPYGVPVGTILAWDPPDSCVIDDSGILKIQPPKGWAVCDGTKNTPDLRGHFLRGYDSVSIIATYGGSDTHSHKGNIPRGETGGHIRVAKGSHQVASFSKHYHKNIAIDEEENIPSYFSVVYIIKLPVV